MAESIVPWRTTLAGGGVGLAYGLVARLAADSEKFGGVFAVMTWTFLLAVPIAMGYFTVRPHPRPSWRFRIFAPWLPTLAAVLVSWAVGWEGSICIVMGLPVLLPASSIGGVLGGAAFLRRAAGVAATALVPLVLGPLEHRFAPPTVIHVVETTIVVAAPVEAVWAEISSVPTIHPEEQRPALFTRLGFPRPLSATLSRPGVGGVRLARFERGVLFVETVTAWEPGRRLAFRIAAQTDSIPPDALDRHVTIGGRYFDVLRGEYALEPSADGGTRLRLRSDLRLTTGFNVYAAPWADAIMRSIQTNILAIVRTRAERRTDKEDDVVAQGRLHREGALLRKAALAYPDAYEERPWGHHAIKVNGKAFVFLASDTETFSLSTKLPSSAGVALKLPFASPTGYGLGRSGWVTARFPRTARLPIELLEMWIDESYRAFAPKRLVAKLGIDETPARSRRRSGPASKRASRR